MTKFPVPARGRNFPVSLEIGAGTRTWSLPWTSIQSFYIKNYIMFTEVWIYFSNIFRFSKAIILEVKIFCAYIIFLYSHTHTHTQREPWIKSHQYWQWVKLAHQTFYLWQNKSSLRIMIKHCEYLQMTSLSTSHFKIQSFLIPFP